MKTVFVLAFLLGVATAAPQSYSTNAPVPILKQSSDIQEDGSYQWEWEAGNGIKAEARGALKNPETQSVQGSWSWKADDGQTYTVTYIADENGFQPQGAHLPTPPPIPEAILKSLEWNAAHPEPEQKSFPSPTGPFKPAFSG